LPARPSAHHRAAVIAGERTGSSISSPQPTRSKNAHMGLLYRVSLSSRGWSSTVDRAKMNKAFYDALKPGGELVVGDYSAKPGAGTSVVQSLHRSDEALVTSEIEAAGFKLIDHGDFLHVPGDARDAPSHSSAQPVDIYMLKFRKPG
jgi:predicted methyltransferase